MDGEKLTFAFLIRDPTWSAAVAASSRSLAVARTTSPLPEDQSSPDVDARDFICCDNSITYPSKNYLTIASPSLTYVMYKGGC